LWPVYEKALRHAAGLGVLRKEQAEREWRTEHRRRHADVLVVGGGPAGVSEAKAAAAAGADGLIVQGVEAGGHVRGTMAMLDLLERVLGAVDIPVMAAGGIVDREQVKRVVDAGAVAAVLGTRFLLSEECRAHPDYKQRCLDAHDTILTELFGVGWPGAPHRVIANAATRRWLGRDTRGPAWIRGTHHLTSVLAQRLPESVQAAALQAQRPSRPFFGPEPPTDDQPASSVDARPLYAGVGVAHITDIRPAAQLVHDLTP
jgi:NAD(P)H-dependent flavin oxidoreductase YrpB (nitropropane dioxygenase family)